MMYQQSWRVLTPRPESLTIRVTREEGTLEDIGLLFTRIPMKPEFVYFRALP